MSLQDFGVERFDRPRLKVKDEDGRVACPVTHNPIEYTEGEIEIAVASLADATLKGALSNAGVSSVRAYGFDSPHAEVVVPETCRGPEAAGWSDEFVGVEVSFTDYPRYVPVRRDDLAPAGRHVDALQVDGVEEIDAEAGGADEDEDEPGDDEQRTRVGHCQHDETDVYIGRHGDGGEHDFLSVDESGAAGWLGNPYPVEVFGRQESVAMFTHALLTELEERPELRRELVERCRGKVLGCWCQRLDEDGPLCHGEVIARVVDDVIQKVDSDELEGSE
ncbi:DUF4326 domain-containing protein [Haloplanus aerogenes]|uniref:DUF4326 domain-containing protein n=1 Tax=Haloplanus aerogenes TaxID=660522 RepID=A0A3M0CL61_9EURY|nr:DUF4326 domain-containing protein [Haloplanus aerogenes]AZH26828.1 DUF4326 domain-containing protein [Haloplanus aerogenes]RMB09080.1 uncharacterized protein DUF4326 [Haloplanus aerogenes]